MRYDELAHWGILGMKWGVRRYQNEDGSLTPLGREHYNVGPARKSWDRLGKNVGVAVRATGRGALAAGKAIGKGSLAVGKAVGKEALVVGKNVITPKIPSAFLTNDQLMQRKARLMLEKDVAETKRAIKKTRRGRQLVANILEQSLTDLSKRATKELGNKIWGPEQKKGKKNGNGDDSEDKKNTDNRSSVTSENIVGAGTGQKKSKKDKTKKVGDMTVSEAKETSAYTTGSSAVSSTIESGRDDWDAYSYYSRFY